MNGLEAPAAPAHTPDAPAHAVRAIVAGHGTFAEGIVSAVEQITGRGALFATMTNFGLCRDDIQQLLLDRLEATGAKVVFTDLPAGSCTMAVRRVLRERPDITLVTGVNLSLLLDFAMKEDSEPVAAAHAAIECGKASMTAHGA